MNIAIRSRSSKNPFGFLFVLTLFLIAISLVFYFGISNDTSIQTETIFQSEVFPMTLEEIRIFETVSGHAYENHGSEVSQAFNCLKNNGTWKSLKTFGFMSNGKQIPTNVWICTDGLDFFAIVSTVFEKIGGNNVARLVTAYKVSKEMFPAISDYILYLGTKWGAIEINYIINAGDDILLR